MSMSKEILARHFQELKNYHNVLNVGLSTKFRAGADTGVPSITVYVRRKLSEDKLEKNSILPKEIEGVPVDVVELNPSTWEAGLTFMSEQLPEHQLNRLGLKEKPQPRPRLQAQPHTKTPSGFQTWVKWCSPIQDQENCGSCTAFGNIGIMEASYPGR